MEPTKQDRREDFLMTLVKPFVRVWMFFDTRHTYIYENGFSPKRTEPYVLLGNHTFMFDVIHVPLPLKKVPFIVASHNLFVKQPTKFLLSKIAHAIPKTKSASDIRTARELIGAVKRGYPICIFPEGNTTFNGETTYIEDSTMKLIKKLEIDLVTVKVEGGYLSKPRWATSKRKNRRAKFTFKIAIPKESVFTQRKVPPTASAVLNLREGTALSQRQIAGIKNFIGSAIPKLLPENIKLINQNGSLLENSEEDIESLKYIQHEKYKTKLEYDYENKIKDLLSNVLGGNRMSAKVSIELDFTKQEISQEIYDPEGTIRSQQTTEIASQSDAQEPKTGGVPGVQSNIEDPEAQNGLKTTKASSEEAKNVTNYEISKKIINQKNNAYASIANINAAVTFDAKILEKIENKEEFLAGLNSIVQEAIGYKEKRGDRVTVKAFKYIEVDEKANQTQQDEASLGVSSVQNIFKEYEQYIQYLVAMILLFVFYKKFIANNEITLMGDSKAVTTNNITDDFEFSEFDTNDARSKLKAKVKSQILNNLDGLDAEEAAKYEVLIEQIDKAVSDNPQDIAQMIKMLLQEGDSKFKSKG